MNSADLERAWRSPRNSADPAALATARDQLFARLRKRRRARRLFLALVLGALTPLLSLIHILPGRLPYRLHPRSCSSCLEQLKLNT